MYGRILAFVLCPALLAAGGCARTDDGTVVIPRQLDVRRVWDKPPRQPPVPEPSGAFPAPPHARAKPASRRYPGPAPLAPAADSELPDASSAPRKPLACHDVSETGRRFRVVCD